MVNYPDLSNIGSSGGLLALPNASYPFFWTIILAGIFIVLTLTMFFREKSLTGRGNLLSSGAVAGLACIMLGTLGSLVGIFRVESFVPILVFLIWWIVIWIVTGRHN